MALKAYKADSNQARYTAAEFSAIETLVMNEGVLDLNGTSDDFEVTESSPAAMSVDVKTGAALVEYTKDGVVSKLVVENNATITKGIDNNATGDVRVDAVIIHLTQDEPNTLKTNIVEVVVVTGTGNTALVDGDINTLIGDTNWYRLADINVPDAAVSVVNANITDTREETSLKFIPESGVVFTEGDIAQTVTGNKTYSGDIDFSDSYPTGPGTAPTLGGELVDKDYVDNSINSSDPTIIEATTGEAIDGSVTPKAVFISNGVGSADELCMIAQAEADGGADRDIYGVRFYGQSFSTEKWDTLTKIYLYLQRIGDPAGDFRVRLYEVDGNDHPTGAPLGTVSVDATSINNAATRHRVEFDFGDISLDQETRYVFVADCIDGDSSHYIRWFYDNTNPYGGNDENEKSSLDAGGTWSETVSHDFMFEVHGYETQTAGRIYMTDSDYKCRGKIDGFIFANYAEGVSAQVRISNIQDGFAGLTIGDTYRGGTAGAVVNSGDGLPIGKAITADTILIEKENKFVRLTTDHYPGGAFNPGGTGNDEYLHKYHVGFKPSKIEINLVGRVAQGALIYHQQLAFIGQVDVDDETFYGNRIKVGNDDDAPPTNATAVEGESSLTVNDDDTGATTLTVEVLRVNNGGIEILSSGEGTGSTDVQQLTVTCYR